MLERLQKIIARAGIASRRHAEELIVSGQVTVNGVVVTELGVKADPDHDKIEAAGRVAQQPESASYYMLHKPPHVVSTMADPEGRATLRHVLRGLAGGVFPVGRLDYAASGLILLTSDGQLADAIFKVSSTLVKVYWVKVDGRPSAETLAKITHKSQARVRPLRTPDAAMGAGHAINPWYEAEMRDPRRDLLRQAFFAAGHPVEKTKRVRFGPLDLGDLPEGQYRQLTPAEVTQLRRAVEQAAVQAKQTVAPPPAPAAVRPFERKKWRSNAVRAAGPAVSPTAGPVRPFQPVAGRTSDRGNARPGDRPSGRPEDKNKKKWQPSFGRGSARPGQHSGPRPARPGGGQHFGGDRFAAGGKGMPSKGAPGGGKLFPPRGEQRGPSSGAPGPRPSGPGFGQRSSGPRFGRDKFPPSKGAPRSGAPRGDRPFRPSGERSGPSGPSFGRDRFSGGGKGAPHRGGPAGSRPFPPRDERTGPPSEGRFSKPGGAPGQRSGGQRFGGDRFASGGKGAPSRGGASGGRPFPPRGERSGPPGGSRGAGFGGGQGDSRGGYRGKSSGKFSPRPPRPGGGAPSGAKFGGKRPGGRPPRKPDGRPPRPAGRPPRRSQ